jgi:multicomponent Na+:H+ antiporter subunit E
VIRLERVLFLTAIWVFLWGDLSVANVLSGAAVSLLVLAINPDPARPTHRRYRPRPVATARLVVFLVKQLVVSNALVTKEIVTRRSGIRAGIVACELRTESEAMVTFLANVLSLSPGTMPVEVRMDPPMIYIHVLHLRDPVASRLGVARLERLAVRAFGSAADVERVRADADVVQSRPRRRSRA